ncbi:MAG: BrnT family toxin [Rhodothermales bacterium]|nr:BrnT family toxin [Rhodothermales bacterium]
MAEIEFEWDPRKDRSNRKKHGVSFDEAATAFYDEEGLLLDDPDHSDEEDRFVLLGLSSTLRLLVVVHAYRGSDAIIRIISARKATRSERDLYRGRLGR